MAKAMQDRPGRGKWRMKKRGMFYRITGGGVNNMARRIILSRKIVVNVANQRLLHPSN
jgi:hypothetical protein